MPPLVAVAVAALLVCALLLALPRSSGCGAQIVRLLALVTGAVAPLILTWRAPSTLLDGIVLLLAVIATLLLGTSATALAATGWRTLLQSRPGNIEDQVDLSIFDPSDILNTRVTSSSSSTTNELESCFLAALMALVGGLFWLGLHLTRLIATHLLPGSRTLPGRAGRVVLSLIFGVCLYAGITWGLLSLHGGAPRPALGATLPFVLATAAPGAKPETATMPPVGPVALSEANQHLDTMWRRLDRGSGLLWSAAYSPLFPSEWPPTPATVWVRYAYAYGRDPQLADGNRVALPWARVEIGAGTTAASIIPLRTRLDVLGTQGVQPLDKGASATLARADQIFAYCLRLMAPPTPNAPETTEMRAYYRGWLRYNGVIAQAITPRHAGFEAWLRQGG